MNGAYPGHAACHLDLEHFESVVFAQSKLVELDHTGQASHLRLIAQYHNYY